MSFGLWCLRPFHYALSGSNSHGLELQHQSLNLVFSVTINLGAGRRREDEGAI